MDNFPEIRTLIFTLTVVIVCRAVAMAYVWFIGRGFRPVRYWANGAAILGIGALLIGFRDLITPLASVLLGQTFVVVGWLLLDAGIICATGRRIHWPPLVALTLASIAGVGWFQIADESFRWRTAFVTIPEIVFDLYAVTACFQARNKLRVTLRMLGGAVALLAISNGIKLYFVFDRDVSTLFLSAWQISQFYIVAIAVAVYGTVISVLLAMQHVQERLVQELAAHRNAEMNLRNALQRAEQFRLALDNVPSIVFIKDRESRFTYANRQTLAFFKCTEQDLIGSTGEKYLPAEVHDKVLESDQAVLHGETVKREIRVDTGQDDNRVFIELKTPVYSEYDSGKVVALCGIATDITDIKLHERLLEHVAHVDSLTGLPNRLMLHEVLDKALAGSARRDRSVGIAYIDLDGFKAVNDELGHDAGDDLLRELARRMLLALRRGDTLARVGGDEFIAVLIDVDHQDDSESVLRRLLAAAAREISLRGSTVTVSASIGLSIFPADGTEADQLIRRADEAMYHAKRHGRNRYFRFSELPAT